MGINSSIASTYLFSNKRLTGVAVFGVVLGLSIYIFMNSLLVGFDKSSNTSLFRNSSHIRIYQEDQVSEVLEPTKQSRGIIINPTITPFRNTIINPAEIQRQVSRHPAVVDVAPEINATVFYSSGTVQLPGQFVGVLPEVANRMYAIQSFMVEGNFDRLSNYPNGIVIGVGLAEKLYLKVGDPLTILSSKGVQRNFTIIGIFKTSNSVIDETKSYIQLPAGQQLLKENGQYISSLHVNLTDPEDAEQVAKELTQQTGYKAEGWKEANETVMAANKMRKMIITFVSFTILLIAGFGIYTILNMTVSQKIDEIAILKAMGFKGKDVIQIFVTQAISIGLMGIIGGSLLALFLVFLLQKVYLGGDIGYFPIDYEPSKFVQGNLIGLVITFFAGYIPARKAANVDPVSIFRK